MEVILNAHVQLDLERIRTRLDDFDQAPDRTELLDEFNRIVTRTCHLDDSDSVRPILVPSPGRASAATHFTSAQTTAKIEVLHAVF